TPDSVWCERCIEDPETAQFAYDSSNFYWRFTREAYSQAKRQSEGKFLLQFPDLIEGLDTLAAMRGTDRLLADLIERPEWVHGSLRRITDLYFRYYDMLYDLLRDEVGGSVFWIWAPGRLTKLQCDFSAMISPAMFREFMVPVLTQMAERVSYSLYHLDGPNAIGHLEALLSIPRLGMIQWTPGAGSEPHWHP
ncbi:MAG: trimethylamine corrinoid protein 2, partial [Gemmatimonadales bacterium]|nr:trimethylamine corrinoid protein 2 [Gemmatimonadales bacterium]